MTKRFSKFLYILAGARKKLVLLLFMAALTSVLETFGVGLIGPFLSLAATPDSVHSTPILKDVYVHLGLQSSHQFIPVLGIFIVVLFCVKSAAYILTNAYICKVSFEQKKRLIARMMDAYLKAPYVFLLKKDTASIIQNITLETAVFTQEYMLPFLTACVNLLITAILLLLLAQTNLSLLVMILGILLSVFLIFECFGYQIREWGRVRSQADREMIRSIQHSFGGLKETRIIGCESYFQKQIYDHSRDWARAVTRFRTAKMIFPVLIQTFLIISVVIFVCISFSASGQNPQELTSVMAVFATASLRLIPSANNLINSVSSLHNSGHAVDIIYADLKEIDKIEKTGRSTKPSVRSKEIPALISPNKDYNSAIAFTRQISLQDIFYSYPDAGEQTIKGISLSIKKGESIALIGKSGAGKTTLVDILLGLLEPQQGDISVDGVSIYNNLRSWQNLIGYIPQSIFLTDDTMVRNIAFGIPDDQVDYDRLHSAIEAAQLTELLEQLPYGMHTKVGERGVRLSGGQRQRVGIARALYHEREILVLDEATAALDNTTERLVNDAIKSLAGTKTLIIIAHRLSTVEHCDRIYLLDQGRIAKSGSYQEVVLGSTPV
jgi:ABC-type multidrug transport system fused ATPase/permease subunit